MMKVGRLLMLIVALFASFIITQPWLTMGIMVALYTLSIPLGVMFFIHQKRAFEERSK